MICNNKLPELRSRTSTREWRGRQDLQKTKNCFEKKLKRGKTMPFRGIQVASQNKNIKRNFLEMIQVFQCLEIVAQ